MFWYKCTILSEYNMPGLKSIAVAELLFKRFHSLQ